MLDALASDPELAENTYVIYTADHGLAMGSHGLLGKQSVYEHSMGCPLLIKGPGVPEGKETEAMTYLLDLNPTILSLAGLPAIPEADGADLSTLWSGSSPAESVRDSVFLAFFDAQRSVRDERWKLHVYPKIGLELLYDLENDPHETVDLRNAPWAQDIVASLHAELKEWQEKVGDTEPMKIDPSMSKVLDFSEAERRLDRWQPDWIVEKYFGMTREEFKARGK